MREEDEEKPPKEDDSKMDPNWSMDFLCQQVIKTRRECSGFEERTLLCGTVFALCREVVLAQRFMFKCFRKLYFNRKKRNIYLLLTSTQRFYCVPLKL